MIARALKFVMVLTCGQRKNPVNFCACRVISNRALPILLNHFHFGIVYHAIGYKPKINVAAI